VGRLLGVTRERVRQLEQRALTRLRAPGRRNRLAAFAGAEDQATRECPSRTHRAEVEVELVPCGRDARW
jgi:hypothetical protein